MLGVKLKGTHIYTAEYDSTKANFDELEKRVKDLETMEIDTCDRLTALEAKPFQQRSMVCSECPDESACPCAIDCESLPGTCGTCAKAWRHEEYPEDVLCLFGGPSSHYVAYPKDKPACLHHDRREA